MLSFHSRLPLFLALTLLGSPLALRADGTQPSPPDTIQQATEISYRNLQAQPDAFTADDIAVLVTSDQRDTDPVTFEPVQAHPIDGTPVSDQPLDPGGSTEAAVTPEPSGVVLLATGALCCTVLWMRRRSSLWMPC